MEIVNPLAQNEGIECSAVVFFMALITPYHLHSFHDRVCLHKESFLMTGYKNIILNFIIYSSTLLWLFIYDFIKYYLYLNNINIKSDIAIGISIDFFSITMIVIPFILNHVKSKIKKIIIGILYFCFSTYTFFPYYPYKWIYFSFGTVCFFYFIETFISFLTLKSIKEILSVWLVFLSIFVIIFIFVLLFWKGLINSYLFFLLKYLVVGYLSIIFLCIFRDRKVIIKRR